MTGIIIHLLNVDIKYNSKNITIVDSYKIGRKDMKNILEEFVRQTGFKSRRTMNSWLREWRAHNRLYKLGLFRSHTKDCDLEEYEKLHRKIVYLFLGF